MSDGVAGRIQVRLVSDRDDVVNVAPLFDSYRIFYGQPSDIEASFSFLLERWKQRETVIYFASVDDEMVGFVQLFPSFASDVMRRLWILNDLFVKPAYRRLDIGHNLMKRAEQHAQETDSFGLTLSTAISNLHAQALYLSEGYVRDDAFPVFNKHLIIKDTIT
jgi:GNAT superfamily N-acetyltransferase